MKRRFLVVAVFLASLFTFATLSKPTRVQAAGCTSLTVNGGSSFSITFTSTGQISYFLPAGMTLVLSTPFGTQTLNGGFSYVTFTFQGLTYSFSLTGTGSVTFSSTNVDLCPASASISTTNLVTFTHFTDGRLNDGDAFETSALYCLGDGSVRVYVIGDPKWTIAFTASPAAIAAVPKHPDHNTLIKAANGAALYRLTSGLLQVNSAGLNPADGPYHFAFEDCPLP